ncbi:hypothetical protein [Flocculibacter collagenilyticus]|uniref:hypothetical protein n=1 Tax=Flocculibacter collagenilyticus TaxID=2744479 RepID=UPI0018F6BDE0|nr:hypothetical protein [Flocculibacter collagenilyticus]
MKKQTENKLFAFKLAEKKDAKETKKWQARDGVATAGCSGMWARGPSRWGSDTGMYC